MIPLLKSTLLISIMFGSSISAMKSLSLPEETESSKEQQHTIDLSYESASVIVLEEILLKLKGVPTQQLAKAISIDSYAQISVTKLLELTQKFTLSDGQREVLAACSSGNLATVGHFLKSLKTKNDSNTADSQLASPAEESTAALIDLMLLIALKANQTNIVLQIIELNPFKVRNNASMNSALLFCSWILCEALIKADVALCTPLAHYIISSIPLEYLNNVTTIPAEFRNNPVNLVALIINPLATHIRNLNEADAWCALFNGALMTLKLPASQPQALMRACFTEDTGAVLKELKQLNGTSTLAVGAVLQLAVSRDSGKMLRALLNNPDDAPHIVHMKEVLRSAAQTFDLPQIETVLNEIDACEKIDLATRVGLPAALWKEIVAIATSNASLPAAFSGIAKFRLINRAFNNFMHDKPFLEQLLRGLNRDAIPPIDYGVKLTEQAKSLGHKYLSSYCASLLSKTIHSEKERLFLRLVQSPRSTWETLFDCLITPEVTKEVLAENAPLLKFATVCLALSNKSREKKAHWDTMLTLIHTDGGKSMPSKASEAFLRDLHELCGIAMPRMLTPEQNQQSHSTELSYISLIEALMIQGLFTTSYEPLLQLPAEKLIELIHTFILLDDQSEALTACYIGDLARVAAFLPSTQIENESKEVARLIPRKQQGCTPILVDLMLLIALKKGHKDIALHIIASNPIKERDPAVQNMFGFFCTWMAGEAVKQADAHLCSSLAQYIFSLFPLSAGIKPETIVFSIASPTVMQLDSLRAWCTFIDGGLSSFQLPPSGSQPFMEACFKEDTKALSETLVLLLSDSESIAPYLITSAAGLICMRNSLDALKELLNNPTARHHIALSKESYISIAQRENLPEIEALLREL